MAHRDSSTTTVSLHLSTWRVDHACSRCGATIPAGTATRHFFEGGRLMVVCQACARDDTPGIGPDEDPGHAVISFPGTAGPFLRGEPDPMEEARGIIQTWSQLVTAAIREHERIYHGGATTVWPFGRFGL